MNQVEIYEQGDLFDAQIIPLKLAIKAMRDSGYKNTAYALAELIDNSVQATADCIEVICIEKREITRIREVRRLWSIGVLDNGSGMNEHTLRKALQFGNGTRLDDRTGIGRFGMGLPNSSISQAARVEVWSWQNGPDNAIWSYIDLEEIESQNMKEVPKPQHSPLPDDWREISDSIEQHGTLVFWSKLDVSRLTWKKADRALLRTEEIVGRVYRKFIKDDSITIRLCAIEQDQKSAHIDYKAKLNDPLYLTPLESLPSPFDKKAMFESVFDEDHLIEHSGKKHKVKVRYSVASGDTITESNQSDRGKTKYGRHAAKNIGVSVVRAHREIMLDYGWCIGYDPRERWWGAEVKFDPELDEIFGVPNNKQGATHFAELATTDWKELAEEGEPFRDVVNRLKEEGDPRGWLLELSDSIKRNLQRLREHIRGQSKGVRSSNKKRHNQADEATETVNKAWKKRSKTVPLGESEQSPTQDDLNDIRTDLTQNKDYSEDFAEELVSLIKDADLSVVFLEADFPDSFQLFNVELKGNITEIVFNRRHPAFDDIFGTVTTVDEDVSELLKEELIERLTRACNSAKVIFAAWARYEREAGLERASALERVRFDWGQIASKFLRPESDL